MTRPSRAQAQPAAPLSDAEREELVRLRQKVHDKANEEMREAARAKLGGISDVPLWLKIAGAALAALMLLVALAGTARQGVTEGLLAELRGSEERLKARMDYAGRIRDGERDRGNERLTALETQQRADTAAANAANATMTALATRLEDAVRRIETAEVVIRERTQAGSPRR